MLREWAYAATYQSSRHRHDALPAWLHYYNSRRPHSALGHKTLPAPSTLTNAAGDLHLGVPASPAEDARLRQS